ncbi:MAG: shikimate kinase [Bacteroidales bacterium]
MEHFDKIFLIGFMGSGKSTTAKKLASKLGWTFIDLDQKIEEKAGKRITQIFSGEGEDWFRRLESETLREAISAEHAVISTGGGTPCYSVNMDLMVSSGLTVYLKMTPEQLRNRLSHSTSTRPLLKGMKEDELLGFIERKLDEREKWYLKARIIADPSVGGMADLYSEVRKHVDG